MNIKIRAALMLLAGVLVIGLSLGTREDIKTKEDFVKVIKTQFTYSGASASGSAINGVVAGNASHKTSSGKKKVKKPQPTATPLPRHLKVRQVALACEKKISYLWGGKARSIKTMPKRLDCSGFIQYVYWKATGERKGGLYSTWSIAGSCKRIKQPKIGDLGMKYPEGSSYRDVNGKKYYEESQAKSANKAEKKKQTKIIEEYEEKIDDLKKDYKEYKARYKKAKKGHFKNAEDVNPPSSGHVAEKPEAGDKTDEKVEDEQEDNKSSAEDVEKDKEQEKKHISIFADKKALPKVFAQVTKIYNKNMKKYKYKVTKAEAKKKKCKKIKKHINHVGILVGKTKTGKYIWCHCSSSNHGVTVGTYPKFKKFYHVQ